MPDIQKYKSIALNHASYEKLAAIADTNNRAKGRELAGMIDKATLVAVLSLLAVTVVLVDERVRLAVAARVSLLLSTAVLVTPSVNVPVVAVTSRSLLGVKVSCFHVLLLASHHWKLNPLPEVVTIPLDAMLVLSAVG